VFHFFLWGFWFFLGFFFPFLDFQVFLALYRLLSLPPRPRAECFPPMRSSGNFFASLCSVGSYSPLASTFGSLLLPTPALSFFY